MPKRRVAYADALSRFLFAKDVAELTPAERAELDVLRAMDADEADERRYEQLATEFPDETRRDTLH
jgi:hypothetical protein